MLTDEQIRVLLEDIESDNVERTVSNAPVRFYWFSDRIEIQNPGGLYGAATDFPNQNDYRNPKIAEAMKNLGYVNCFGYGIATVQSVLLKNGNPPAEFVINQPNYFLVTVPEAGS